MNWPVRIIFLGFLLLDILSANPLGNFIPISQVLKKNLKCLPDSTFYTPTDVEPECMAAALNCIFLEFANVVAVECKDSSGIIDTAVSTLELTLRQFKKDDAQNSANDCACEKWPQRPIGDFLANIEDLFLRLRSQ